jgi:ParB-like chromosome segregation protein Spo0J
MQEEIKITNLSTASLVPYAKNSRTHSPQQISQIELSIKEFGFLNPVIIDSNKGIIAGHARVMAAKNIGLDKIPTIEASHLTDQQRNAYVIADNKLALNASWDEDILKLELLELDNFHQLLTGFDASELNILFNGWQPEFDVKEKNGLNLDGIAANIKISVDEKDKTMALEAITNALDSAGVEYEFK